MLLMVWAHSQCWVPSIWLGQVLLLLQAQAHSGSAGRLQDLVQPPQMVLAAWMSPEASLARVHRLRTAQAASQPLWPCQGLGPTHQTAQAPCPSLVQPPSWQVQGLLPPPVQARCLSRWIWLARVQLLLMGQAVSLSPEAWLELARSERVTNAFVVPTMLARVIDALSDAGSAKSPAV